MAPPKIKATRTASALPPAFRRISRVADPDNSAGGVQFRCKATNSSFGIIQSSLLGSAGRLIGPAEAARFLQGAAQQILDLGIQTAQVGVGPALQRLVRGRVE